MKNGGAVDTAQLLKGALDLAVLAVLDGGDSYGYDVVRRLRESGLPGAGDASVYGTLRRLHQAGVLGSYAVASDEGPHRKSYRHNERGRALLAESARAWLSVTEAMDTLLIRRDAPR